MIVVLFGFTTESLMFFLGRGKGERFGRKPIFVGSLRNFVGNRCKLIVNKLETSFFGPAGHLNKVFQMKMSSPYKKVCREIL